MSPRGRTAMLLVALAMLAPWVWSVAAALPAFGFPTSRYGEMVNRIGPAARHVANMVTVVNFDVRGLDTLGEEMMLIAAVTGTVVLLRGSRGESATDRAERRQGRPVVPRSDATVALSRMAATFILLFGIYIVAQGTETPGGGFQAGVILATGFLLIYLGDGYAGWRRLIRGPVMAFMEGFGGLVFIVVAAVPLLLGRAALTNFLPLGTFRSMAAGGTMIVGNVAVAVAVAGSFGHLAIEFMEETRVPGDDEAAEAEDGTDAS